MKHRIVQTTTFIHCTNANRSWLNYHSADANGSVYLPHLGAAYPQHLRENLSLKLLNVQLVTALI